MSIGIRPPTEPDVLVVIVNFRTGRLVVDCLRSLVPEVGGGASARVAIVDNASGDDSVEEIRTAIVQEGWSEWARVVPSAINGGFAAGNNVALREAYGAGRAGPRYVWILNPDTQVRSGALRALVSFLDENPQAGIVGGMLEELDGAPWPYAFRFPSILSEVERGFRFGPVSRLLSRWIVARRMPDRTAQVDWVSGASMVVRREVFEQIGLMDEGYFLYFEETDFCRQAALNGWQCWYVPASRVMHISGQSTGLTGRQVLRRPMPKYWFDSRRRYFVKNHGWLYAVCADIGWLAGYASWSVRRVVQRKPAIDPPHLIRDFVRFSSLLNPRWVGRGDTGRGT